MLCTEYPYINELKRNEFKIIYKTKKNKQNKEAIFLISSVDFK